MEPTPDYVKDYTVLYVDDKRPNLVVFRAAYGDEFDIICASSAHEALELMASRPVAVLVADHKMPGMTGVELCERVAREYPEVRRLLVTAYSDQRIAVDAINRGGVFAYLQKPLEGDAVRRTLRDAITGVHLDATARQLRMAMVERERLAGLAAARASLLHDLGNIHTAITVACDNLEAVLAGAPADVAASAREDLDDLRAASDYVLALLRGRSRGMGAPGAGERGLHDASEILAAVVRLVRTGRQRVRLRTDCPPGARIFADRIDVSRVLVNLINNAFQAIESAGLPDGEVRVSVRLAGERTVFLVADNGPGIPPDVRGRVFEPAWSTRRAAGGSGLGLAICRELAAANGGTVELVDDPGERGATFALSLPSRPAAARSDLEVANGAHG